MITVLGKLNKTANCVFVPVISIKGLVDEGSHDIFGNNALENK